MTELCVFKDDYMNLSEFLFDFAFKFINQIKDFQINEIPTNSRKEKLLNEFSRFLEIISYIPLFQHGVDWEYQYNEMILPKLIKLITILKDNFSSLKKTEDSFLSYFQSKTTENIDFLYEQIYETAHPLIFSYQSKKEIFKFQNAIGIYFLKLLT